MWVKRLEHPKGVEYKIKKARRRKKTFLAALYYFLGPPTPFANNNVGIQNKIFKNTLLSHIYFGRALFVLCGGFHGQ